MFVCISVYLYMRRGQKLIRLYPLAHEGVTPVHPLDENLPAQAHIIYLPLAMHEIHVPGVSTKISLVAIP